MLRIIQIERRPDRSTHALLAYPYTQAAHGAHTGPWYVRAHVVSNRYRGYRQTSGEINTHRPVASSTTTAASCTLIYIYIHTHVDILTAYITYISARQRRDRGFAEMVLVSRYVNSVTRACIRGVPLSPPFPLMIDSQMRLESIFPQRRAWQNAIVGFRDPVC